MGSVCVCGGGGVHGYQLWPMDYMCVQGYDLQETRNDL